LWHFGDMKRDRFAVGIGGIADIARTAGFGRK
jgi:hypothetical protein